MFQGRQQTLRWRHTKWPPYLSPCRVIHIRVWYLTTLCNPIQDVHMKNSCPNHTQNVWYAKWSFFLPWLHSKAMGFSLSHTTFRLPKGVMLDQKVRPFNFYYFSFYKNYSSADLLELFDVRWRPVSFWKAVEYVAMIVVAGCHGFGWPGEIVCYQLVTCLVVEWYICVCLLEGGMSGRPR